MSAWTAEQVDDMASAAVIPAGSPIAAMLRAFAATLRQQETVTNCTGVSSKLVGQQGEQAGGMVPDEVLRIASRAFDHVTDNNNCSSTDEPMRAALEAVAPLLRAPAERMEDARCPPTYRREEAVKVLITSGWTWDGKAWITPAPAEQCGRVDEGMVDRMIEEYRRLEPEDSKLMEISTTDGETRDFCRSLLQAALAQNAQIRLY